MDLSNTFDSINYEKVEVKLEVLDAKINLGTNFTHSLC